MINYSKLNKPIAVAVAIFCGLAAFGQQKSLAWYTENLPKEHVVKVLDETNIMVEYTKEGKLKVSRKVSDERLLISSQAGAYAQEQIVYSSFFDVHDVEAATYVPRGDNKFKKHKASDFRTEKLMSDRVFHDDLKAIRFEYPDIQMGAKITHSYVEDILNPFFVPPVYLQGSYFSEKIRVTLEAPENVKIKVNKFHLDKSNVNYTTNTHKGKTTHVWEVDSVPQFSGEGGAPNPSYFVPHISFIIEGYQENGSEVPVLTGVDDLYAWYSGLLDSVDHTLSTEMKMTVDSIVNKNKGELKQAQALYDWVRGNVKYIAVEDGLGGFIPDNPSAVTRKRFGDCKGMSCLLATLMRHAGFNARECWIGTRDIPYTYTENYTPFVDNHMITAYQYKDTWYFLDPTDNYVPFGYPSSFIQGKEALIGLGNGKYLLKNVPVIDAPQNMIVRHDTLTINDTKLQGKANMQLSGYVASRFKRTFKTTDDEKRFFKYYLETGNDKFEMVDLPKPSIHDTAVNLNYTYAIPDYLRDFNGTYFINLNMDRLYADVTFEDRKLPLERDYKHGYDITHVVKIPEGYAIKAIPDNYEFTSDFAQVKINYTQTNGFVTYHMNVQLTQLLMQADFADKWNTMVKELRNTYRKNVELKKI